MNAEEEQKATEELAELTRQGLSPLMGLAIYSLSFVCGSAIEVMQEWDYTVQDCLIATAFASLVGILTSALLESKYWIVYSHFSALVYVAAMLCSIPFLQAALSSVQVILFLTSILCASAAYSMYRRYYSEAGA